MRKVMEARYPNKESGGKKEGYKRAISACKIIFIGIKPEQFFSPVSK